MPREAAAWWLPSENSEGSVHPEGVEPQEPQERGFHLQDVWAIVQMQWHVVVASVAVGLIGAIVVSLFATREYSSTVVLHVSPMAGQEVKTDKVLDLDQYQRWNRHMFVQTQLEVLYSRTMRTAVLEQYNALGYEDLEPNEAGLRALRAMMEATPRVGTELLDLTVTSPDAEKSALLANLIADTYERRNLETLQDAARGALGWVDSKLEEWQTRIDTANRELLAYQRENQLADVEQAITALSAEQGSLAHAHAEVSTELALHETTVRAYEELLRRGRIQELAKEMNTPVIAVLERERATAVTELGRLAARYGERHQLRQAAEAELQRIQEELEVEVRRSLRAEQVRLQLLRDRKATLAEALVNADQHLLELQDRKADYDKLRIELERAKDFYKQLGHRRGELEMQAQTQLNNIRIIDRARPARKPVKPNIPINLAVGLLGGLLIGVSVGLLREYVDDTISSPLDVSTYLKVPFLGMIPKIAGVTDETELALYTHRHPRSTIAESIRAIRTVLELTPTGESPRRLLVTSAISAEGKTSTIVRLGVAFANLDKRVLLIDADLRRPRLHKIFGVVKDNGLSAVLHGAPTESCILDTEVPNLHLMPSGPGGDRPNELLASSRMVELLDALERQYDLVLIDSPPSVLLSDAKLLSRYVDGVIVLAREHTASRMLIRDAIRGLEQVGARVLGVVVNAVDFGQRRTSYKYYYGYGYRYDKYYDERRDPAS